MIDSRTLYQVINMNEISIDYMCTVIEKYIQDRWNHNKLVMILKDENIKDISELKVTGFDYGLDTTHKILVPAQGTEYQYDTFRFSFVLNEDIYQMDYIVAHEEVRHYKFVPHQKYTISIHEYFTEVKLIKNVPETDNELYSIWRTLVNPRISLDKFINSQLKALYQASVNDYKQKNTT